MSKAYAYIVRRGLWIAFGFVTFCSLALPLEAQTGCTHGGHAVGAIVHVEGERTFLFAHSGFVPPNGGTRSNSLQSAEQPGFLRARAMSTLASGLGCSVESSASQDSVVILPGSVSEVNAVFVRVVANTSCGGSSGVTTVSDLTVGGVPVVVTGEPNQAIPLPGVGTLIVNDQSPGNDGAESIRVRGLHLLLDSGDAVTVGEAFVSVACPVPSEGPSWGRIKELYR